MQAHPGQGVVQGFSHHTAVHAVPVPGRHACRSGDMVQVDIAIVMGLQVEQGTLEGLFVVIWCFHTSMI